MYWLTEIISAFSEKHEHSKSVFIMLVICFPITTADSFTSSSDILSDPVAFFGFRRLISIFVSSFFCFRRAIFFRAFFFQSD